MAKTRADNGSDRSQRAIAFDVSEKSGRTPQRRSQVGPGRGTEHANDRQGQCHREGDGGKQNGRIDAAKRLHGEAGEGARHLHLAMIARFLVAGRGMVRRRHLHGLQLGRAVRADGDGKLPMFARDHVSRRDQHSQRQRSDADQRRCMAMRKEQAAKRKHRHSLAAAGYHVTRHGYWRRHIRSGIPGRRRCPLACAWQCPNTLGRWRQPAAIQADGIRFAAPERQPVSSRRTWLCCR